MADTAPTVNIALPAMVAPAHVSLWEKFKEDLKGIVAELEEGLNVVAKDAPAVAEVAEGVEVAAGQPEAAAITAGAAGSLVALDDMVNSATSGQLVSNAKSLITSVETVVATTKAVGTPSASVSGSVPAQPTH